MITRFWASPSQAEWRALPSRQLKGITSQQLLDLCRMLCALLTGLTNYQIFQMFTATLTFHSQLAEERIGNIRTVRAFAKENSELQIYMNKISHVLQLAKKEAVARAGFYGAVSTILLGYWVYFLLPLLYS